MLKWFIYILNSFLFLIFLSSCTKVPDGVISQNTMENILYDSYVGEAISETELRPVYENNAQKIYMYSVLKKYGVSKQEYDSSLTWYMSNLKIYAKVYENVLTRLKKEEAKLQLESGDFGKNTIIAKGDTVDLWNKNKSFNFSELPLIGNLFSEIINDDSFVLGDSIKFNAKVRLFNKSNRQYPRMVLTLNYQNDSTQSYTEILNESRIYIIKVKMDTTQRIRSIVAGFYQNQSGVASIDQTSLLRIHKSKKKR